MSNSFWYVRILRNILLFDEIILLVIRAYDGRVIRRPRPSGYEPAGSNPARSVQWNKLIFTELRVQYSHSFILIKRKLAVCYWAGTVAIRERIRRACAYEYLLRTIWETATQLVNWQQQNILWILNVFNCLIILGFWDCFNVFLLLKNFETVSLDVQNLMLNGKLFA